MFPLHGSQPVCPVRIPTLWTHRGRFSVSPEICKFVGIYFVVFDLFCTFATRMNGEQGLAESPLSLTNYVFGITINRNV